MVTPQTVVDGCTTDRSRWLRHRPSRWLHHINNEKGELILLKRRYTYNKGYNNKNLNRLRELSPGKRVNTRYVNSTRGTSSRKDASPPPPSPRPKMACILFPFEAHLVTMVCKQKKEPVFGPARTQSFVPVSLSFPHLCKTDRYLSAFDVVT